MFDDRDYGSRANLGIINPARSYLVEPEFNELAPRGVSILTSRVALEGVTPDALDALQKNVSDAGELLAGVPVDIMTLACTSGSFVNGLEAEQKMIADMEAKFSIPFSTTASSVIAATKAFGIKKVAVATPYTDEVNGLAVKYLNDSGLEVTNIKGLGLVTDQEISGVKLADVYQHALNTCTEDAEMLLILCTGFRTIPIIEKLEATLKIPVVSALQATFWNAMRKLGLDDVSPGYGSLFFK